MAKMRVHELAKQLEITNKEMLQVLGGDDRYAREMLTYRMESRRLEKQARAAGGARHRPEGEEAALPV